MAAKHKSSQEKTDPSTSLDGEVENAPQVVPPLTDLPSQDTVDQAITSDPLDLSRMRLNPSRLATVVGIKAASIRVGRPDDQDFFQVHGSELYSLDTYLLRMKADREFYYVV